MSTTNLNFISVAFTCAKSKSNLLKIRRVTLLFSLLLLPSGQPHPPTPSPLNQPGSHTQD